MAIPKHHKKRVDPKFVLLKQRRGGNRRVVESWSYDVREDARNEAARKRLKSKSFDYHVIPLQAGLIIRVKP